MNLLIRYEIELIDIDHDAGDYACDGGDYIRLLDWLEETGRNNDEKLLRQSWIRYHPNQGGLI